MLRLPEPARDATLRFLRWWGAELSAAVPERFRGAVVRPRHRLMLEVDDIKVTFLQMQGQGLHRLGAVALDTAERSGNIGGDGRALASRIIANAGLRSPQIILRLGRDRVLRRQVELPAAAAENLREVLGFEMDRHTPFKEQEIYYDFRVLGTEPQRKRINVDLVVIPRREIDGIVRNVAALGLTIDRVALDGGAEGRDHLFDLLPESAGRGGSRTRQRLYAVAAVAAVVLFVVAVSLPLQNKRRALADSLAELERAKAVALEVDNMRKQVETFGEQSRFVLAQRRTQRSATEILNEITRLLPDHTWALKFAIRGNQLTVAGYSAKPTSLIALLEESSMLTGVRFSSPVTMDQKVGLERFNVSATVTARGEP